MDPVGREDEEAALTGWVAEAMGGAPRLVLIGGEGGIGKSYLLDALGDRLRSRGTTVVEARVAEDPGAPPFWPWRQVEARLGGAALFGESSGSDPEIDRFARFEAVRTWLVEHAGQRPGGLVLVLEDVHRADLGSLRLLSHVAQHLDAEPLALLATHRPDVADHVDGFPEVLEQIRRWRGTRRLDLQGLGRAAVQTLLGGAADAGVVERVTELSGGNPLFVRELALHLAAGGPIDEVPRTVRDGVAVRLVRRSPPCVETLQAAAVVGREFAAGVLATVLDRPALAVLDALDEAIGAGLVTATERAGRFRFAHVLVRDAVEATVGFARLPGLHRRVAEAIETYEGTGADQLADLARHWDAASALGDRDVAAAWCERAAEAADRRLAWEEATRLYDRSVDLGRAGDPLDRHRRLVAAARASLHVDALDATADRCLRAADAVADLDRPDLVAEAALVVESRAGSDATLAAMLAITERALAGLGDDGPEVLRARLLGQVAAITFYLEPARCEEATADAVAAAARSRDPAAVAAATRARQMFRMVPDGAEERLLLARRMGRAGRELGRASVRLWEPIWTIDARLELGHVPEAVATLADLRRAVAEAPLPIARWHLARTESVLAQATGRFDEALAAGARARDLFAALETPAGAEHMYLGLRNEIGFQVGMDAAGFELWERLLDVETAPTYLGDLPFVGPVPWAVAAGRMELAKSCYAALAAVPAWHLPGFLEIPLLAMRVLAAMALDRSDDLAHLVRRLEPFRGRHVVSCGGAINYSGCVERYIGKADLALGRWDDAVAELRQALALAEAAETPAMAAETAADLATALVGRRGGGDVVEAAILTERFRSVAAALGMHPWVERFDALALVAHGDDPGPLSPRELEVAALVARGLTNKQIATELYLSQRTAQNHVQHILTKLGVANRTQIAAWYRDRP